MSFKKSDKLCLLSLMLVLVLALVGCSGGGSSPNETPTKYQVVFDIKGETENAEDDPVAVEGATVSFSGTEKTTDSEGLVAFEEVASGNKNYVVSADGYEDYSGTANVNGNITVDVTLALESETPEDPEYDEINQANLEDRLLDVNSGLDLSAVDGNINLPADITTAEGTFTITWQSGNTNFIDNEGNVTPPSPEMGNQTVTLTATVDGTEYEIEIIILPASVVESVITTSATNDPDFELTVEVTFGQPIDDITNAGISVLGSARIKDVSLSDDRTVATVIIAGYPFDSELSLSGVKIDGQNINADNWDIDTLDLEKPRIQLTVDDDELILYSDGANDVAVVTAELIGFPVGAEASIGFATNYGSLHDPVTQGRVTTTTFIPDDFSENQTAGITAEITSIKGLEYSSDQTAYLKLESSINVKLSLTEVDEETGIEYIHYYLQIAKAVATQADRIYVDFNKIENTDIDVLGLLQPEDFIVWDDTYVSPAQIDVERVVPDPEKENRVILLLDGPDNNIVDGEGDIYDSDFPLNDNTTHKVELSNKIEEIIPNEVEGELDYKIIFEESEAIFKLEDVTYPYISAVHNYEEADPKYNLAKDELLVIFSEAPNALPNNEKSVYNLDNWVLDGANLGDKGDLPGYNQPATASKDEPFVEMRLLSTDGDDPTIGINKDAVVIRITDNNGTDEDGNTVTDPTWGSNRTKFLTDERTHNLEVSKLGDWAGVTDSRNIITSNRLEYNGIAIDEVEVALIVDNSPEKLLIAFNEPVNITSDDIQIQLGDVSTGGDLVSFEEDGEEQFKLKTIVENMVYLIEMNQDWRVYHNSETNFNDPAKNPIKVLVNDILDFWGEPNTIVSNEYTLYTDNDSPDNLLTQPLTTVIGEYEEFNLDSLVQEISFPHPGPGNEYRNERIGRSDFASMFPFVDFDYLVYNLELASLEVANYDEYNINELADAGAMMIIMDEPIQWADKFYQNTDSIPYESSETLTPPEGNSINQSGFEYQMIEDQFGNDVEGQKNVDGYIAEVGFRNYYVLINPREELEPGKWRFVHSDSVDDAQNSIDTYEIEFEVTSGKADEIEPNPLSFELLGVDAKIDSTTWLDEASDDHDLVHILFTHEMKTTGINSALAHDHYRINGEELPAGGSSIVFGLKGDDRYIGVIEEELVAGSGVYKEKIFIISADEYNNTLTDAEKALFEPINTSKRGVTIVLPDNTLQENANNMVTIVKVANAQGIINPESGTEVYPNFRDDIPFGISISRLDGLSGSAAVDGGYLLFAPDGDFSIDHTNDDPFGHQW